MNEAIRELQLLETSLRRLARAEQKVLASVKARYERRRAELQSALSPEARRLIAALEEVEDE